MHHLWLLFHEGGRVHGCHKEHVACKAWNIYCLALCRESSPTLLEKHYDDSLFARSFSECKSPKSFAILSCPGISLRNGSLWAWSCLILLPVFFRLGGGLLEEFCSVVFVFLHITFQQGHKLFIWETYQPVLLIPGCTLESPGELLKIPKPKWHHRPVQVTSACGARASMLCEVSQVIPLGVKVHYHVKFRLRRENPLLFWNWSFNCSHPFLRKLNSFPHRFDCPQNAICCGCCISKRNKTDP